MESFLKKYGWAIHLAIIALIAGLIGASVNQFIAIQLAPLTVPELAELSKDATKTKRSNRPTARRDLKRAIVQRCLFGCDENVDANACPGGCAEDEVCQAGACVPSSNEIANGELAVLSDLDMKLTGCMVARDPAFSLALMSDGSSKQTHIASVGDMLLGEAEVVEIRRDRIILKRNGRREYIRLEGSIGGKPSSTVLASATPLSTYPPAATDLKRVARPKPDFNADAKAKKAAKKGVKEVGKNKFVLDRKSLNNQLSDPAKLAKQAKIVPNYKNGKNHGIKLATVAPGSVYSKIGIQSGDIVLSIDGKKITSQAKALELLDGMRNSSSAQIEIERRGKRKSLSYTVK